jgi:serine/threonine protein kinase
LPWLAVEFINGPDLKSWVEDRGPLSGQDWTDFAKGLLNGMAAIHDKGLIHRDIKPANILMSESGPKIIDFGIAQDLDATSVTVTGTVAGSPAWLSPEQIDGEELTPASDIFSSVSVLAYAATGESPWGNQTTTTSVVFNRILNKPPSLTGVPEEQAGIIEKLLNKNRLERPTSRNALKLLAQLEKPSKQRTHVITGSLPESRIETPLPQKPKKVKAEVQSRPKATSARKTTSPLKLGRIFASASALALGLVIGAGIFVWIGQAETNQSSPVSSEVTEESKLPTESGEDTGQLGGSENSAIAAASNPEEEDPKGPRAGSAPAMQMPNFSGKTVEDVESYLRSIGVLKWRTSTIGSSVQKGKVARTNPGPGETVDPTFWNKNANFLEIFVSTGKDQKQSQKTLTAVDATISWTGMPSTKNGNWGFYPPTVSNGVLEVSVDGKFDEDTSILLGNNCSYLVDEILRLGCYSSLPKTIFAPADRWTEPIRFGMNISNGGINEPSVFEISLRIKDSKGVRNVKLNFTVGYWK